jgi:hypothetical protein
MPPAEADRGGADPLATILRCAIHRSGDLLIRSWMKALLHRGESTFQTCQPRGQRQEQQSSAVTKAPRSGS